MFKGQLAKLDLTLLPFMSWMQQLNIGLIKSDIIAGIVAGVLIVPQAVALATIAGMPPEYGLYTAIVPVIIAALFGSSLQGLSGPNTALVIMIAGAIAPFAVAGSAEYIVFAITLSFLVGIFQLAFALFGLGGIFNYFSQTVMVALITAVGLLIILYQVDNFVGINLPVSDKADVFAYLKLVNPYALLVGVATLMCGLLIRRYFSQWPHYIIAIVFGSCLAQMLDATLGNSTTNLIRLDAMSLSSLPLSVPDVSSSQFWSAAASLIPAAFFIAILGLTQSTVIARSIASKTGKKVSFNQEVLGQGLSNIVGSFFSCFPSCGSFNRSAANMDAGARTPLAALISAVVLAILVYSAGSLLAYMPVAVMAAILFLVGASLIKWHDIKLLVQDNSESRYVFMLILIATLSSGLQNGVLLGAFLSMVAYWRSNAKPEFVLLDDDQAKPYLPAKTSSKAIVLQVSGSLLLSSVSDLETVFDDLAKRYGREQLVVIAADKMRNIDRDGLDMLDDEAHKRQMAGGSLQLWFDSPKVHVEFPDDVLFSHIRAGNIFYRK